MFEIPLISDSFGEHTYKVVWTVLWVLLSLVTISLLTFARAKPLSKCIFLSLFAHILLLGHAYMIAKKAGISAIAALSRPNITTVVVFPIIQQKTVRCRSASQMPPCMGSPLF